MSPVDRAAAQQLLRDPPPEYHFGGLEAGGVPHEQLEVDDSNFGDNHRRTWLKSLKNFGAVNIVRPVHYIIDPIANLWWKCGSAIEQRVSRYANVLVVKRLLVVLIISCFCLYVGYTKSESDALSTDLRDHARLRTLIHDAISADRLQETTEFLAKMPHFAGSQGDLATAVFVHDTLQSFGLKTNYDRFNTFLSHGNSSLLELKQLKNNQVLYSSNLQEGTAVTSDEPSQQQPPTQMSLVFPGEVEGHLVYANLGSEPDFQALKNANATIALVLIGSEPLGDVALRASQFGFGGVLFMAPKINIDDKSWPEGPDYPYDAIPQGSNGCAEKFPGDILSPGWPSSDVMVLNREQAHIAQIPVAAISWNDAIPLLNSLRNHGSLAQLPSVVEGVEEWWTGPNLEQVVRLVANPTAENRHQMQNVFGQLKGREQPEKMVVIGARIDAMCYGTSQLAGLNVILEVARVLTNLRRTELWEPLRSIYFVLWDGTAHNFAGSTEWVEGVASSLHADGIAYIDLDLGISGSQLQVRGNPVLSVTKFLPQIRLSQTQDRTLANILMDDDQKPILGYGNHLAFEAHTGVPSLQLGFGNAHASRPLDSCYDSIEWMHKYGDPSWERHVALAELVADLAIDIADGPLLPFDFVSLGEHMQMQIEDLISLAKSTAESNPGFAANFDELFAPLKAVIAQLKDASRYYEDVKHGWDQFFASHKDSVSGDLSEILPLMALRRSYNALVDGAIKSLWDINGLPGRNWYKNHYLGPRADQQVSTVSSAVFPGISGAIAEVDLETMKFAVRDVTTHLTTLVEYLIAIKN